MKGTVSAQKALLVSETESRKLVELQRYKDTVGCGGLDAEVP